ncbi:slp1 [[Candida] subhashii]|uniref:Slp1 n=1 Tax=[Candida] subhashii TaxID=561895 RepID=A0A8J5QS47_9ASCO|nr:slp1 [[Candida] subhashii]KAG7665666.1 slp1 [[Candida] subhashii]
MSIVIHSPNNKEILFENTKLNNHDTSTYKPNETDPKRRFQQQHISSYDETGENIVSSLSPSKRQFLHQMSPNVSKKTIYVNQNPFRQPSSGSTTLQLPPSSAPMSASTNLLASTSREIGPTPSSRSTSRFHRPQLPASLKAPMNIARSQTTAFAFPSTRKQITSNNTSPFKLRRANSLISHGGSSSSSDQQQQSSTISSDRFIPSRHNSTTGKLDPNNEDKPVPPNASPQTYINSQTSKIYKHHVAEACGLEVNSRILLYQPLPPERKKPVSLLGQLSTSTTSIVSKQLGGKNSLTPSAASARAKKIPTAPERVLDAPGLVDDFYLNLLAWSSTNLLAIGLEDAVYVWNANTGSVGLLCELPDKTIVTSLRWSNDGSYISIGKDDGLMEIWDIETNTKLRTLNCNNHQTRIAAQDWNQHILTSGSRLGNIYNSDVRVASHVVSALEGSHTAEICGIEYRADGSQFASGGNDNVVCIWDARNVTPTSTSSTNSTTATTTQPLFSKTTHKAAVKALSWCPYQSSLLATGGGSSDKTINFWNTSTGSRTNTIETGSQISSLNWGYANGTGMEIVATHGFPTNSISLYNYPTLQKTGEINSAHDTRILGGCLSPDNLTLATVAGDENLKFWSIFDMYKKRDYEGVGVGGVGGGGVSGGGIDGNGGDDDNQETKRMKKMMNLR